MQEGDELFAFSICLVGVLFAPLTFWLANMSMKYYDLIDVIPIHMASVLVFNIVEGLIILDEFSAYSTKELIGISIGILCCCFGITILMFKNKDKVKTKAMTKDDDESDEEEEMQEMRYLLLKFIANEG